MAPALRPIRVGTGPSAPSSASFLPQRRRPPAVLPVKRLLRGSLPSQQRSLPGRSNFSTAAEGAFTSSQRYCVHEGDRVQASVVIERLPTKFVEPAWARRWRLFEAAWKAKTKNALDIADDLAYMHLPSQFLEKSEEEAHVRRLAEMGVTAASSEEEMLFNEQVRRDELLGEPGRSSFGSGSGRGPGRGALLGSGGLGGGGGTLGELEADRGAGGSLAVSAEEDGDSELEQLLSGPGERSLESLFNEGERAGPLGKSKGGEDRSSSRRHRRNSRSAADAAAASASRHAPDRPTHSLTREPTQTLYLVVKYRSYAKDAEAAWTFPRCNVLAETGMRETLELLVHEQLGLDELTFVGKAPGAWERFASRRKVFYYRARVTPERVGGVTLPDTSCVEDFAWVRTDELQQYVKKRLLRTCHPLLL